MTTIDIPRLAAGRTVRLGLSRVGYEVKTYFRQHKVKERSDHIQALSQSNAPIESLSSDSILPIT